jgi:hypothetical protein
MPARSSDPPALRPTTSGQRVCQGWSGVKRGGWGMGLDWVSSLRLVRGDATALTACSTRRWESLPCLPVDSRYSPTRFRKES